MLWSVVKWYRLFLDNRYNKANKIDERGWATEHHQISIIGMPKTPFWRPFINIGRMGRGIVMLSCDLDVVEGAIGYYKAGETERRMVTFVE